MICLGMFLIRICIGNTKGKNVKYHRVVKKKHIYFLNVQFFLNDPPDPPSCPHVLKTHERASSGRHLHSSSPS